LTTGSRRNRFTASFRGTTGWTIIRIFVLLSAAAGRIPALELTATCAAAPPSGSLTVRLSGLEEAELREHLHQGFRARMEFFIEEYRKKDRFFPRLGDELLFRANPSQTGRWDPFSACYELSLPDGSRHYYPRWKTFLEDFAGLREFPVPEIPGSRVYILVQARFQKMVFLPPMNILTLFPNRNTVSTSWSRLGGE